MNEKYEVTTISKKHEEAVDFYKKYYHGVYVLLQFNWYHGVYIKDDQTYMEVNLYKQEMEAILDDER